MEAKKLGSQDLNLDCTSQSRMCCHYTIPQYHSLHVVQFLTASESISWVSICVKHFFPEEYVDDTDGGDKEEKEKD